MRHGETCHQGIELNHPGGGGNDEAAAPPRPTVVDARPPTTLRDPSGNPVDREVYSVEVQSFPGDVRRSIKSRFNDAERVSPGVYEGIVPIGPGLCSLRRRQGRPPSRR